MKTTSDEMGSPVAKPKVSANWTKPASRRRTRPCAVWIFSGSPLKFAKVATSLGSRESGS